MTWAAPGKASPAGQGDPSALLSTVEATPGGPGTFWAPSTREAWAGWSEPSLGLAPPSNRQQLKAVVSLVVVFVLFFSFETFT